MTSVIEIGILCFSILGMLLVLCWGGYGLSHVFKEIKKTHATPVPTRRHNPMSGMPPRPVPPDMGPQKTMTEQDWQVVTLKSFQGEPDFVRSVRCQLVLDLNRNDWYEECLYHDHDLGLGVIFIHHFYFRDASDAIMFKLKYGEQQ